MEEDNQLERIVEFAIEKEKAAQEFSLALSGRASGTSTQEGLGSPTPVPVLLHLERALCRMSCFPGKYMISTELRSAFWTAIAVF
jgi:hypothetical protein